MFKPLSVTFCEVSIMAKISRRPGVIIEVLSSVVRRGVSVSYYVNARHD